MAYLSFRDYGIIGNEISAALVSRMGSIDWCCLPYLDSPSHFGAILDENRGGSFQIAPVGDFQSEQRYFQRSNVLETKFETPNGRGVLIDWMPVDSSSCRSPIIHRRIETIDGEIEWAANCTPRFEYGAEAAHIEIFRGGVLFRGSSPSDTCILQCTMPLEIVEGANSISKRWKLTAGQSAQFLWVFGRHGKISSFPTPKETADYWQSKAHRCQPVGTSSCLFAGPWHEIITRSGLLLKLMITQFRGSVTESITTSIPALTGGSRNWDYRYAWLRETALAIQALDNLGYHEESNDLFQWLSDILIRDGSENLQPVYTLDGGRYLPEREIPFLSGYVGSRPVRVGNLSARQFQLDIFGHVMLAVAHHYQKTAKLPQGLWPKLADIAEYICQAWRRPDRGPWEVRTKPEHFVASKVLCWVTLDRACWLAETQGEPVPSRWREERAILHRTICEQGYDDTRQSFVRAFGERDLDAATLLIPLVGFLPWDDHRVQTTMDAINTELSDGVLIHRYRTPEGLPESDGAHLLSSFWYISCLALSGRVDEASDRLAEICTYATPLGLFSELVNPTTGEPAGNFPSSSSHLALINAGLYVGISRGKVEAQIPLIGTRHRVRAA